MINISQLRHPSTLNKITRAWTEVIQVAEMRGDRAVRYVLDRKGKEWIRMEKTKGEPVIVYFRGYGSEDLSDLIRQALGSAYQLQVEVPPTKWHNRVLTSIQGFFK